MKTLLFACHRGAVIVVLLCIGLTSCSEDEIILPSASESSASFKQNTMDTVMFQVLAKSWNLSFSDSTEAVLNITVHPGYFQPGPINPYGSSNEISRGYEVLTSLIFQNSSTTILLEGFHPGDYPYSYSFIVFASIGLYPSLEFDLLYYYNRPTVIKGVFYNNSGVAMHFTGTN